MNTYFQSVRNIATENPNDEQWRLLSQYSFPSNARKYLDEHGFKSASDETIELIAGSIKQGKAFFDAANTAPLDISPLLLYYGATSLLIAIGTMMTGNIPTINNHGMTIPKETFTRLAEVKVNPKDLRYGALQNLSNVFSDGCTLVGRGSWTLGEIIASIPDLKQDFENYYLDLPYFTVPVEVVHTRELIFERISKLEISRYPDPASTISRIDKFNQAYLPLQDQKDFIILFRRENGIDIGNYSITGRKFLNINHDKQNRTISPHQVILLYMGLYALGFLPRYRQSLWNPFVRSDTTGELVIIEKFVDVCKRHFPNLMLNFLLDRRVQFINDVEGVLDLTKNLTADEIKNIVRETLMEIQSRGGIR